MTRIIIIIIITFRREKWVDDNAEKRIIYVIYVDCAHITVS